MKRNYIILINVCFVILAIICLIFSFYLGFFFFLPIICFLPFIFKGRGQPKSEFVDFKESPREKRDLLREVGLGLRYCPSCGGEIKEPIAKFCYHCGSKLNNS